MGMGLLDEGITEIIAVTKDNAAPIGIILREGQCPKLILFKGSKTEENIRRYGWMTANFVSDSLLYPKYAFSDAAPEELASDGEYQYLKAADAWILFKAEVTNETEATYLVDLTEVKTEILRPGIRRVNRGFDAVIDATVHATRYIRTEDPDLKEKILYDFDLIRKCGGKQEQEAKKILETVCRL